MQLCSSTYLNQLIGFVQTYIIFINFVVSAFFIVIQNEQVEKVQLVDPFDTLTGI